MAPSFFSKRLALAFGLLVLTSPSLSAADNAHPAFHRGLLLDFQHMYGVDGPFIGDANAIGGIEGDELPWDVGLAQGRLDANGNLLLHVRGVVFKNDPSVPPDLRGINDETEFRAAVVCLTEQGTGVAQQAVFTMGFPATRSGDATIRAHLTLPNPCVAPIVLVLAGSEEKWFAVNGFEAE